MSEHKKYTRQQIAIYDKQQTTLTKTGTQNNVQLCAVVVLQFTPEKTVLCPFCLTPNKLMKFYISNKKGIDKRLGKCPNCQNNVMYKTLFNLLKWTPQQFAKWVFEYRLSGFWQKIVFKKWKQRLYELDMSLEFWQEYKKLRGDPDETTQKENDDWEAYTINDNS